MNQGNVLLALALPVALSACAATTVKGMQKREPVLIGDSAKPAAAVIACVSDSWVKLGGLPRVIPRETGTMITLGELPPQMVVDTTTTPNGTHVVMHLFKSIWAGSNRSRVEEVRACL
jgi:hypothetical protein